MTIQVEITHSRGEQRMSLFKLNDCNEIVVHQNSGHWFSVVHMFSFQTQDSGMYGVSVGVTCAEKDVEVIEMDFLTYNNLLLFLTLCLLKGSKLDFSEMLHVSVYDSTSCGLHDTN